MALNLLRPSSSKDNTIGWFKPDGRSCKKHPKHRQSPGVCSLCLREKLSQLSAACSASSSRATAVSSNSSSSPSSLSSYYSSSASSSASPMHHLDQTNTNSLSISFLLSGKQGLMKSRSVAIVPRTRDHNTNMSAKKGGFWFRLLHPKTKRSRTDENHTNSTKLLHSTSLRETVAVAS